MQERVDVRRDERHLGDVEERRVRPLALVLAAHGVEQHGEVMRGPLGPTRPGRDTIRDAPRRARAELALVPELVGDGEDGSVRAEVADELDVRDAAHGRVGVDRHRHEALEEADVEAAAFGERRADDLTSASEVSSDVRPEEGE